ncbi:MAG: tRNA (N6-threonylcarbamoyladenosine(37)-N6)-methyltransferase TrmO [Steroidobacteraceae bacterium]|jgi:tRNA-Thr(GGU) m(6)t(6)A37 methyltransferase TsaA|nr:tRNA (N6-threonylcarbamoyladenosine(37)-N6)-methyltransferase TrmO [Steroidobacteraceae bacterium]
MPPAQPPPLSLEPIGFARTGLATKVDAPRQPRAAAGRPGRIELLPGRNFEHALDDLDGWDYLWVIFWFHLNPSWRPKVLPPRSTSGRKGVFSTRSPHRPNPLGLSAVRLERVDGLTLHLLDMDLVDGTPVLDIKPYVPYTDAHPDARSGWLEHAASARTGPPGDGSSARPADPLSPYDVQFSASVIERCAWIESRGGLALVDRVRETLALGPAPHPYRRIRPDGDGFVLAAKEWRFRFRVAERRVQVTAVYSGYRHSQLATVADGEDPLLPLHREFVARFGD